METLLNSLGFAYGVINRLKAKECFGREVFVWILLVFLIECCNLSKILIKKK
jgi:hypothetical protein